jgi:transposase
MKRNIKIVTVTSVQRAALEKGARYGSAPSYRLRCQAILLKCEDRTSAAVAAELGCCEMSVNDWMKRFTEQGMDGLKVAKGRGRKGILGQHGDLEAVRRAVVDSRQRIGLAKAELEKELGKEFSQLTLRRFLKKTVAVSNELGG